MRNLYKETEYFLEYEAGVEWDDIKYIKTKGGQISVEDFQRLSKEINYEPQGIDIIIDNDLMICFSKYEFGIRAINLETGVEGWRYICTNKNPYDADVSNKNILLY